MKFAFFFPGQGSQSVGMMQGLADIAVVRQTFDEASDLLGQDFWSMVTEPNEALNQTTNTQPLMLTAGVATWRAWQGIYRACRCGCFNIQRRFAIGALPR
jgi:[acyl-carrier-protein] S-malonyltransferase